MGRLGESDDSRVSARELRVVRRSDLPAPAETVWSRAVSPEGINHELGPALRMTMPRSMKGRTIDDVEVGRALGRSWILLFGLIPFDYDDICLVEIERGRRFLERSSMFSMSLWQHEREVSPVSNASCSVTDRLTFVPRGWIAAFPGGRGLARTIVNAIFRHRHRRLRRHFGD